MKRFSVEFTVSVDVDVSEDLIEEVMRPDWQKSFYKFAKSEDVADHLAYNFACNHATLNSLDGFAHFGKDSAKVVAEDWSEGEVKIVVRTKPKRKKA